MDGERERERPVTGPLRLEEEQTYYEILETEPGRQRRGDPARATAR